jgi:hypothetical protein
MLNNDQNPSHEPPKTAVRTVRRKNETARFIERFPVLTGFHVHSTSVETLPRSFLIRQVPPPNILVEKYGNELEIRTCNALRRYEPGKPQSLWTYGRLLEIRGFGIFSLLDLLEVLAKHATISELNAIPPSTF